LVVGTLALVFQKTGPSLEEIGRLIGPELRKNWKKQEIIAEPGRFYCA